MKKIAPFIWKYWPVGIGLIIAAGIIYALISAL